MPKAEEVLNTIFNDEQNQKMFGYLWGRWQDEKEYEDPADYEKHVAQKLESHGVTNVKMTKRPFGFKFDVNGASAHITVTSRQMKMAYRLSA